MKQPYGIFAEVSGELKLIHTGSVRFSRANRFALKQTYPGVFFSHYVTTPLTMKREDGTEYQTKQDLPAGERHKPKRIDVPDWSRRPDRASAFLTPKDKELVEYDGTLIAERKRRRRHGKLAIDYDAVDPNTGETLGDVVVEIIRERAARGIR